MTKNNEEKLFCYWTEYKAKNEKADFTSFKAGFEACCAEAIKASAIKNKRKSGSLVITDFINESLPDSRWILKGVHYEDDQQIVTDGRYIVVYNSGYETSLDNKTIDKNGRELAGSYPNYKKVIPDNQDRITMNFTLEDFKIIAGQNKSKSMGKLYNESVLIDNDFRFAIAVIKTVTKFWACYPEAILTRHEDSEKAWKLEAKDGSFIVFMPMTINNYTSSTYNYNSKTKVVVKAE